MQRCAQDGWGWAVRPAMAILILGLILAGAPGVDCDHEAATTFRQTATGPIGEGVKSIVNGVLDGAIAAVQNAGDGAGDGSSDGT